MEGSGSESSPFTDDEKVRLTKIMENKSDENNETARSVFCIEPELQMLLDDIDSKLKEFKRENNSQKDITVSNAHIHSDYYLQERLQEIDQNLKNLLKKKKSDEKKNQEQKIVDIDDTLVKNQDDTKIQNTENDISQIEKEEKDLQKNEAEVNNKHQDIESKNSDLPENLDKHEDKTNEINELDAPENDKKEEET